MILTRDLIIAIFGEYTPVTYSVYNHYTESLETVVANGLAGVDWCYVLGVLGFFLVLFCILRILGGLICAR